MNINLSRIVWLLFLFLISEFPVGFAEAQGTLKLLARSGEGKILITLEEEDKAVFGQIREGFFMVTPVQTTQEGKTLNIIIGDEEFAIDRLDLGRFINYGGVIWDQRGISAQAENDGARWMISGTIEDDLNNLIDFDILADEPKGTLKLKWKNSYLFLKRQSGPVAGKCRGALIKEDSDKLGRFWCSSTGSLKDAFFNDPDQILAWIVIPFVR